jgi:hypothetical protein
VDTTEVFVQTGYAIGEVSRMTTDIELSCTSSAYKW